MSEVLAFVYFVRAWIVGRVELWFRWCETRLGVAALVDMRSVVEEISPTHGRMLPVV